MIILQLLITYNKLLFLGDIAGNLYVSLGLLSKHLIDIFPLIIFATLL